MKIRSHRHAASVARCLGLLLQLAVLAWAQHADADTSGAIGVGGVFILAIDPQTPTTLYADSICAGLLKSTDGAASWVGVNDGLPDRFVGTLAIDSIAPSTIYAGPQNGLIQNGDISKAYGVFKSTDGGASWLAANAGMPGRVITALALDTITPGALYAATDSGLFKSTNGGDSWQAANAGLSLRPSTGSPSYISALAIDPLMPNTLYAGVGFFVFKSTDGAGSWHSRGVSVPAQVLAIDPLTPSTLYAGRLLDGEPASVLKSTDSASTWHDVGGFYGAYLGALAIDPVTPRTLYAGTLFNGVFKSTDGASSWQVNESPGEVRAFAIDPVAPDTLYAATDSGLFKSTDGASTWHMTGLEGGAICGDGVQCGEEECDDGNTVNGDGCDANCTLPRCGNGIVDAGEECDNGNGNPNPVAGCTYACTICGNGIVTAPEQCDDGNSVNGDACETSCTLPSCGNGIVDAGEQCDDGNMVNADACDANCTLPGCGNGILDAGEECDDGNTVNADGCDANCTAPRCGNGIIDAGEECDDGNRNPFDGCTNACTICGDGIVTPPEECDDGNTNPSDGCTNACTICGNGRISAPETCDDGNTASGDGCDAQCQTVCGNGVVGGDEECDDGGSCIGSTNAGAHCTAASDCPGGHCQPFGGDGCAANCTLETDVAFNLAPGVVQGGIDIAASTSGAVFHTDILTIPLPFRGSEMLTIGKERNGEIPVVIKAAAVQLARMPVSTLACFCPRAVAAKTCGGTVFEPDGVTPSPDCTPGFTAGDSACAGKPPCTFVHGPGNSASGVIGCDGLDGVNVSVNSDGSSGTPRPPRLTMSGTGSSGSAVLFATTATGGEFVLGQCTGQMASVYGPDGEFCTDDDPQDQRGSPVTVPVTTATARGQVLNANMIDGNDIGPSSVTGHAFNCGVLAGGSAAGAALASVSVELAPVVQSGRGNGEAAGGPYGPLLQGEFVTTNLLVAAPPCAGDCDGGGAVTVNEIITLVNIALSNTQPASCPHGVPSGTHVEVTMIIQAVNNALNGCGSGQ